MIKARGSHKIIVPLFALAMGAAHAVAPSASAQGSAPSASSALPLPPAASSASAQPALPAAPSASVQLPPPPDASGHYYSTDALPSGPLPPAPGFHFHDGFYLRASMGFGGAAITAKSDSFAGEIQSSGTTGCFDLAMAGTPSPGVAIGGAVITATVDKPKVKSDQGTVTADSLAALTIVGPMVDVFLNPEGGFHLGGMVGPAVVQAPESTLSRKATASGFGAAAWTGYAFWVSSEWSLGGLARLTASSAKGSQEVNGVTTHDTYSGLSIAVLATALYH